MFPLFCWFVSPYGKIAQKFFCSSEQQVWKKSEAGRALAFKPLFFRKHRNWWVRAEE